MPKADSSRRESRSGLNYSSSVARRSRFTPYAARKRRSLASGTLELTVREQDEEDEFYNNFLYRSWRIFRASPLYKLEREPRQLRRYSVILSAHLESALTGRPVSVGANREFTATFSLVNGIPKSVTDENPVQIKVSRATRNGAKLFHAYLCGVDCKEGRGWCGTRDRFSILPLILTRGPRRVLGEVLEFLREYFDCATTKLFISPLELSWMTCLWATVCPDSKASSFQLVYRNPSDGVSRVEFTLHGETVDMIWTKIHDSMRRHEVHEAEREKFVHVLERNFRKMVGYSLEPFYLDEILTSAARIGTSGKLKVFSRAATVDILRHLTFLCQEGVLYGIGDDERHDSAVESVFIS